MGRLRRKYATREGLIIIAGLIISISIGIVVLGYAIVLIYRHLASPLVRPLIE